MNTERKKGTRERNLEKKREQAIAENDGVLYLQTSTELGFDLDEVPHLKEEGLAKITLEGRQKELEDATLKYKSILGEYNPKSLYRNLPRQQFKGLFGRLKKAGYQGPEGEGMKDYSGMSVEQMWSYFSEIRRDLEA